MRKILVVEDDRSLNNGIILALKSDGFVFTQAYALLEAKTKLAEQRFDLLILDINLPDGSGLDLLSDIRQYSSMSVIVLTANDTETDVVTGLEMGADDYITKPFSLMELRARVHAQLRKLASLKLDVVRIDNFLFDFARMEFFKGGTPFELSKTEQKLLRILVENRGITVTREELVDRIWTNGAEYVDENALSVTIKRLRDKIEEIPSAPKYIKTVYGIGYTWGCKG